MTTPPEGRTTRDPSTGEKTMTLNSTDMGTRVAREIGSGLNGEVIGPDHELYDDSRIGHVGGFDRRPLAIVHVADAQDVARVIGFARDRGIELAVRCGGHSPAGFGVCDGGIVLDVSRMKELHIDPKDRTAWAQTGLTAGEYTSAAGVHGLATAFGDTGSVGIGGLTIGGGVGYLVRKHGLTIDSLLAAEIVTADGQLHRVDAENEPDLFWAIRGGGGNFGVVTRFKFRLVEVPSIVGGMLILPATADTIAGFVAAAEAAPEELSAIINIMAAPPAPFIPPEWQGRNVILAGMAYAGPAEAGLAAVAPFRALATPIADMIRPMTYPELYVAAEGPNLKAVTRNMFLDHVDRATGEAIVDRLSKGTSMIRAAQIRVLGGAVSRVPNDATAYGHRDRRILINVVAAYMNPAETPTHAAWVAETAGALDQGITGAYVNFISDEGLAAGRAAYPDATWDRLAKIKSRYDPKNLFHRNQNVPPA